MRSITPVDNVRVPNSTLPGTRITLETLPGQQNRYLFARMIFSGVVCDQGKSPRICCQPGRDFQIL